MKTMFSILEACEGIIFPNDQTKSDADVVVRLDEVRINDKIIGLYYWPWKNEYVTWIAYSHDDVPGSDGKPPRRNMHEGCYFSANTTSEERDQKSGLQRAILNFDRRARYHGWKVKRGYNSIR